MSYLKTIVASFFVGLIAGLFGEILIKYSLEIKEGNPFWWLAFF